MKNENGILVVIGSFFLKKATNDEIILKIEKKLTDKSLDMKKTDEIKDHSFSKMRTTGGKPPAYTFF